MNLHEWRAVLQFFAGSVALKLLTLASFRLRLNLATVVRPDLVVVLLSPRRVNFLGSARSISHRRRVLTYLFAPAIFCLRATDPFEVAGLISVSEAHGNRLWNVDNAPYGASFHFTLPAKVEASK